MSHLHAVRTGLGVTSRPSNSFSVSPPGVRMGTGESCHHLPLALCFVSFPLEFYSDRWIGLLS